ncbi:MAG: hypothetical protein ACYCPP_09825 [Nitrososphaerales archaeon]
MTSIPRSLNVIAIGIVVLCTGLLSLIEMPRITPYEFFNCSPYEGGTQCFGSINPIYPIIFIVSMAGAVLVFLGLFGGAFTLGPGFLLGMVFAGFGLAGIIFGYIAFKSCVSGRFPGPELCPAYHPEAIEPFVLVGALLLAVNAFWRNSGFGKSHWMDKQVLARFLGVVSVAVGAIMISFGWMVVGTFVGNFDTLHSVYWMQIAIGLLLVAMGIVLIGWSLRLGEAKSKLGLDTKNPVGNTK